MGRAWPGALASVSPTDAAQLYVNVKPLIDEAYIELGHGGSRLRPGHRPGHPDCWRKRPTLSGDPVLNRRPGYFEHDDPALRALRPVQKQFLLMGPDNRRRLLDWLRQFATALDRRSVTARVPWPTLWGSARGPLNSAGFYG